MVYRWSRLSGRRLDQLQLIELLGRVESASEAVDVSTAGGHMSRDLLLSVAAYESEVKSGQFKEALQRRADAGLPKDGALRFGYRRPEGGGTVVVALVGSVLVLGLLGIVGLALLARPVPDVLQNVTVGAVAGLIGLLAPNSPRDQDSST